MQPRIDDIELTPEQQVGASNALARRNVFKQQIDLEKRKIAYKKANRIEFFRPNPPQAKIFEAYLLARYRTLVATGSNQFGKTALGCVVGLSTMFGKYLWTDPPTLIPFTHNEPRKVRYMAQDWDKHAKTVVVPELKKWWPASRPRKVRSNQAGVEYFWTDILTGSTLEIMTAKQEPAAHAGWTGDLYIPDEPFRKEVYNEIIPRLIVRRGKILMCLTLLLEHAWIDQEIIKAVDKDGMPRLDIFSVHGNVYDNLGFGIKTKEQIDENIKAYGDDQVTIDARVWGIPAYLSGLVYPMYKRDLHVIPETSLSCDNILDVMIDVHPREKQAVSFREIDERGNEYIVDEIWEHLDPVSLAHAVIKKIRLRECRTDEIRIDPLAKGDSNNTESVYEKMRNIFWAYGYTFKIASRDKEQGIMEVKKRLMGPNRMPSLFFFSKCKNHIREIEKYCYDKDTQKPIKKDDHFMENLYGLALLNRSWYPKRKKVANVGASSYRTV